MQKFKNNEARPKFTGSYKKKYIKSVKNNNGCVCGGGGGEGGGGKSEYHNTAKNKRTPPHHREKVGFKSTNIAHRRV